MIWAPDQLCSSNRTAIVEDLLEELRALCGDVLPTDGGKLEDIACAIEDAIGEIEEEESLDSGLVLSYAARALSSIGEEVAARRLFLFGSGMVRPSDSCLTGDQTLWVLDMAPVTVRPDPLLELTLFGTIDRILDSIADVWDESDGFGGLGLTNLGAATGNGDYVRIAGGATPGEVVAACQAKLRRIAENKGWRGVPDVLNLEVWRAGREGGA